MQLLLRTFVTMQIMLAVLSGCNADGITGTAPAVATVIDASTHAAPTEFMVDVVINASRFGQTIGLNVGQIFQIEPPSLDEQWQVDYDPVLFEPLTLPQDMPSPGPAGWRFRAAAVGDGQIVLASIVECADPPCPLMPIRFQINFKVK